MSQSEHDRRIDYIEFPVGKISPVKEFYERVFGWKFTDYGDDYSAFEDGRITGGFAAGDPMLDRGALVVMYATDLEAMQREVEKAGGTIVKPIFSFPGGRRFHFRDPSGHELAVWSDQ